MGGTHKRTFSLEPTGVSSLCARLSGCVSCLFVVFADAVDDNDNDDNNHDNNGCITVLYHMAFISFLLLS